MISQQSKMKETKMEQPKNYFIGEFIFLNIVKKLDNEELWNLTKQYWYHIIELNINDIKKGDREKYIADQWELFKEKGVVSYKPSDEADVKAIAFSLRKTVKNFVSFKNIFIGDHIRLNLLLDQDRKEGLDILYKYFHKLIGFRLYDPNDIVTSDYVDGQWENLKKNGVVTYRRCDEKEAKKIVSEMKEAIKNYLSF